MSETKPRPTPPSLPTPGNGKAEQPATKADLWRVLWKDLTTLFAIFSVLLTAYIHLTSTARAETDRSVATEHAQMEARYSQTDARVSSITSRLEYVEQKQKNNDAELFEMRKDLREFYKAWSDGRRSQRLEQPLAPPDGGN